MFGRSCLATHESPALWRTSFPNASGSIPQRVASESESESAVTWMNQSMLVSSFAAVPVEVGPMWWILAEIASSAGRAADSASSVAPHMITSVPSAAPSAAPVTGASTQRIPRSVAAASRAMALARLTVERLTSTEPGCMRLSRPCSPKQTASTSGGPGTDIITTGSVIGPGAPAVAPSATTAATRSGLRSSTVTAKPFLSKLRTMPEPMEPRPTKRVEEVIASD